MNSAAGAPSQGGLSTPGGAPPVRAQARKHGATHPGQQGAILGAGIGDRDSPTVPSLWFGTPRRHESAVPDQPRKPSGPLPESTSASPPGPGGEALPVRPDNSGVRLRGEAGSAVLGRVPGVGGHDEVHSPFLLATAAASTALPSHVPDPSSDRSIDFSAAQAMSSAGSFPAARYLVTASLAQLLEAFG